MEYVIEKFAGLNQAADELSVAPKYAAEAENVDTEGGALRVGNGNRAFVHTALTGGIGTLAAFYQRVNGVTTPRLIAVNALGIYEWRENSWQARFAQAGSNDASAINYQVKGTDVLLVADGKRPVLTWDGGPQMTALAGCDRAFAQLALNYERIWGAGLAGEPDSVYWSRAFDPSNWTGDALNPDAGGGVLQIPTWNGGSVEAIRALFGDVLVFKDEDLYRIVGTYPGNYEVVKVHGVVGPVAKNSIVSTGSACYFLAKEGLCVYNGVSVAPVGDELAKGVFARINQAAIAGACAAFYRGKLHLALPLDQATSNNAILEIDPARGTYLLSTGVSVTCLLPFGDALLMTGGDGTIDAYAQGETRAFGVTRAFWRTPWSDLGRPGIDKRVESVSMFARGNIVLTLLTDAGKVKREMRLGKRMRPVTVPLGVNGRRFTLTIENAAGADFEIAPGLSVLCEMDG
ncbi:MAG: hypothetical protein RSD95_10255 [Clostridia bacterium]